MADIYKDGILYTTFEIDVEVERMPDGEIVARPYGQEADIFPYEDWHELKQMYEVEEAFDLKEQDLASKAMDIKWESMK